MGLADGSYILSGHSCGACLAFQAILQSPSAYGLAGIADAPCPAAIVGLNGLYDLVELVNGLGASHAHLRDDYAMFLSNAFGADQDAWRAASPARIARPQIADRTRGGKSPRLILLDQSPDDQLVPMNQMTRMMDHLREVPGLRVIEGQRCSGRHAAPWEQGGMIVQSIRDVQEALRVEGDHRCIASSCSRCDTVRRDT
jgi:kynurenine formamidase